MTTPTISYNASWATCRDLAPAQLHAIRSTLALPVQGRQREQSLLEHDAVFPTRLLERVLKALAALPLHKRPALKKEGEIPGWGCLKPALPHRTAPRRGLETDWLNVSPSWLAAHRDIVSGWKLRGDYQERALRELLARHGGLLAAAAGGGKTVITARLLEILYHEGDRLGSQVKVLWLAQTKDQVEQARAACALIPGFQASKLPHSIQFGCWQAVNMRRRPLVWERDGVETPLEDFDVLVGDEVHASADAYYKIAQACTRAWWRVGMSATPVRGDGAEILLHAAWGEVRASVQKEVLQEQGFLVPARVEWRAFGREDELRKAVDEAAREEQDAFRKRMMAGNMPPDMIEERCRGIRSRHARQIVITRNTAHHEFIAAVAREQLAAGHAVLVLVHEVAQGRAIAALIEGAVLLHSNSRKKDTGGRSREGTLEAMRAGEIRCLVATSLADQGLDVPAISCVVMATGGKGGADGYLIQQRVARAQRIVAGKDGALIVDVYHAADSMTARQAWARFASYKQLGYAMARLPEAMTARREKTQDMFSRRAAA